MSELNIDCLVGYILINPFLGKRVYLNYSPDLFLLIITGKSIIPDTSIEPERKRELDGLLVTLGYDKKISWEIPDWEIPSWFLTYVDPKESI